MRSRSDALITAVLAGLIGAALSACGELDQPPLTELAGDSADQVGYGVVHNLSVEGVRRMRLEADSAYAFFGPQSHLLFGVTVTFFSPQGVETSTLTSVEGTYYWRTGNMEARGDVVAITPDGRRLETSILQYDRNTDQINGPASYLFITPERRAEGESFTSDPDFRNVVTTRARGQMGRVRLNNP